MVTKSFYFLGKEGLLNGLKDLLFYVEDCVESLKPNTYAFLDKVILLNRLIDVLFFMEMIA